MAIQLTKKMSIQPGVDIIDTIIDRAQEIVLGKEDKIRLALCCILARGHLLIEDLPGVGKTTLAHVLARVLGLEFSRIQFTSDLLPADIIGVSVFQQDIQQFKFHPGPIFTAVVLADEINRATPKAQSALLEAMAEQQISVDGKTWALPDPYFVVATQNPQHQIGTFPLPESQLDRFLMRIQIGYPDREAEKTLLRGENRAALIKQLQPVANKKNLIGLQNLVDQVRASEALIDYVQNLVQATRDASWLLGGLSPRAGIALLQAARAWALLQHRDLVLPEDVQAVAESVIGHRLIRTDEIAHSNDSSITDQLLRSVPIP